MHVYTHIFSTLTLTHTIRVYKNVQYVCTHSHRMLNLDTHLLKIKLRYIIHAYWCEHKSQFKLDSKQAFEMATQEEVIDLPICMHGFSIGDEIF